MNSGIDEKTNSAVKSSVTQFETEAKSVRTAISDRGGSPLDRFSEYPEDLWLTVGELTVSDDNAPEAVIKNAPVLRVLSDYTVVPFSYKYDYVHGVPEGAYGYNEVQHMVMGGPTGRKYNTSTLLRQSGFENSVTIKEVVHDASVVTINPDSTYIAGGVTWANSDVKTSCHTMTCELPDGSKLSVIAYADEIDKFLRAANDNNIRYSANTNWFAYFGASDQFGNNEGISLEAKYDEGKSQKYSIVVRTENGTKEYYEWDESTGDPVKSLTSGFPRLAQWFDEHDWNTTSWTLPSACFRNSSIEKFVDVISGINPYVIDDDAFDNCRMLKEVSIAGTLKKIGDRAFRNCYSLSNFDFSTVSEIGESAFENCLSLTSLTITKECKRIGSRAFANCSRLTTVSIPTTTEVAADAFIGVPAIDLSVNIPAEWLTEPAVVDDGDTNTSNDGEGTDTSNDEGEEPEPPAQTDEAYQTEWLEARWTYFDSGIPVRHIGNGVGVDIVMSSGDYPTKLTTYYGYLDNYSYNWRAVCFGWLEAYPFIFVGDTPYGNGLSPSWFTRSTATRENGVYALNYEYQANDVLKFSVTPDGKATIYKQNGAVWEPITDQNVQLGKVNRNAHFTLFGYSYPEGSNTCHNWSKLYSARFFSKDEDGNETDIANFVPAKFKAAGSQKFVGQLYDTVSQRLVEGIEGLNTQFNFGNVVKDSNDADTVLTELIPKESWVEWLEAENCVMGSGVTANRIGAENNAVGFEIVMSNPDVSQQYCCIGAAKSTAAVKNLPDNGVVCGWWEDNIRISVANASNVSNPISEVGAIIPGYTQGDVLKFYCDTSGIASVSKRIYTSNDTFEWEPLVSNVKLGTTALSDSYDFLLFAYGTVSPVNVRLYSARFFFKDADGNETDIANLVPARHRKNENDKYPTGCLYDKVSKTYVFDAYENRAGGVAPTFTFGNDVVVDDDVGSTEEDLPSTDDISSNDDEEDESIPLINVLAVATTVHVIGNNDIEEPYQLRIYDGSRTFPSAKAVYFDCPVDIGPQFASQTFPAARKFVFNERTSLQPKALSGCLLLTSVSFSPEAQPWEFPSLSFDNCPVLSKVETGAVPEASEQYQTMLRPRAFNNCVRLYSVSFKFPVIAATVDDAVNENVGDTDDDGSPVFMNCPSIHDISFEAATLISIPLLDEWAGKGVQADVGIKFGGSVLFGEKELFKGRKQLTSLSFSENGEVTFRKVDWRRADTDTGASDCFSETGLKSVSIPSLVPFFTILDDWYQHSLPSGDLGSSTVFWKQIPDNVFSNCPWLESVDFGATVKANWVSGCSKLKKAVFRESIAGWIDEWPSGQVQLDVGNSDTWEYAVRHRDGRQQVENERSFYILTKTSDPTTRHLEDFILSDSRVTSGETYILSTKDPIHNFSTDTNYKVNDLVVKDDIVWKCTTKYNAGTGWGNRYFKPVVQLHADDSVRIARDPEFELASLLVRNADISHLPYYKIVGNKAAKFGCKKPESSAPDDTERAHASVSRISLSGFVNVRHLSAYYYNVSELELESDADNYVTLTKWGNSSTELNASAEDALSNLTKVVMKGEDGQFVFGAKLNGSSKNWSGFRKGNGGIPHASDDASAYFGNASVYLEPELVVNDVDAVGVFSPKNVVSTNVQDEERLNEENSGTARCKLTYNVTTKDGNGPSFMGSKYIEEADVSGSDGIAAKAFYNCQNLSKVTFSYKEKETAFVIGNEAFGKCTRLEEVRIPPAIIGENAFSGCSTLGEVELGAVSSEPLEPSSAYISDKIREYCAGMSPPTKVYLEYGYKWEYPKAYAGNFTEKGLPDGTAPEGMALTESMTAHPSSLTLRAMRRADDYVALGHEVPSVTTEIRKNAFSNCPLAILSQSSTVMIKVDDAKFVDGSNALPLVMTDNDSKHPMMTMNLSTYFVDDEFKNPISLSSMPDAIVNGEAERLKVVYGRGGLLVKGDTLRPVVGTDNETHFRLSSCQFEFSGKPAKRVLKLISVPWGALYTRNGYPLGVDRRYASVDWDSRNNIISAYVAEDSDPVSGSADGVNDITFATNSIHDIAQEFTIDAGRSGGTITVKEGAVKNCSNVVLNVHTAILEVEDGAFENCESVTIKSESGWVLRKEQFKDCGSVMVNEPIVGLLTPSSPKLTIESVPPNCKIEFNDRATNSALVKSWALTSNDEIDQFNLERGVSIEPDGIVGCRIKRLMIKYRGSTDGISDCHIEEVVMEPYDNFSIGWMESTINSFLSAIDKLNSHIGGISIPNTGWTARPDVSLNREWVKDRTGDTITITLNDPVDLSADSFSGTANKSVVFKLSKPPTSAIPGHGLDIGGTIESNDLASTYVEYHIDQSRSEYYYIGGKEFKEYVGPASFAPGGAWVSDNVSTPYASTPRLVLENDVGQLSSVVSTVIKPSGDYFTKLSLSCGSDQYYPTLDGTCKTWVTEEFPGACTRPITNPHEWYGYRDLVDGGKFISYDDNTFDPSNHPSRPDYKYDCNTMVLVDGSKNTDSHTFEIDFDGNATSKGFASKFFGVVGAPFGQYAFSGGKDTVVSNPFLYLEPESDGSVNDMINGLEFRTLTDFYGGYTPVTNLSYGGKSTHSWIGAAVYEPDWVFRFIATLETRGTLPWWNSKGGASSLGRPNEERDWVRRYGACECLCFPIVMKSVVFIKTETQSDNIIRQYYTEIPGWDDEEQGMNVDTFVHYSLDSNDGYRTYSFWDLGSEIHQGHQEFDELLSDKLEQLVIWKHVIKSEVKNDGTHLRFHDTVQFDKNVILQFLNKYRTFGKKITDRVMLTQGFGPKMPRVGYPYYKFYQNTRFFQGVYITGATVLERAFAIPYLVQVRIVSVKDVDEAKQLAAEHDFIPW